MTEKLHIVFQVHEIVLSSCIHDMWKFRITNLGSSSGDYVIRLHAEVLAGCCQPKSPGCWFYLFMPHALLTSCQSCTLSCCFPCLRENISHSPVLPLLSFPASPVLSKQTFNNIFKRPSPSVDPFFYKDKNLRLYWRCWCKPCFCSWLKSYSLSSQFQL